jgi:hypothetical protein
MSQLLLRSDVEPAAPTGSQLSQVMWSQRRSRRSVEEAEAVVAGAAVLAGTAAEEAQEARADRVQTEARTHEARASLDWWRCCVKQHA